jgi:hypothetical protein
MAGYAGPCDPGGLARRQGKPGRAGRPAPCRNARPPADARAVAAKAAEGAGMGRGDSSAPTLPASRWCGRRTASSSRGVTITGKADRIDRLADGTLAMVDYKTGKPPSKAGRAGLRAAAGHSWADGGGAAGSRTMRGTPGGVRILVARQERRTARPASAISSPLEGRKRAQRDSATDVPAGSAALSRRRDRPLDQGGRRRSPRGSIRISPRSMPITTS